MRIEEWHARYRRRERAEDFSEEATPLLVETVRKLAPGKALDLACGTGRNALWLASHGWSVRAVDGAPAAIEILNARAHDRGLRIQTQVADLESAEFKIEPDSWDLIAKCYYLQRSLIPAVKAGVRPRGIAIVIVHLVDPGEQITYKHATPGELRDFFADWEMLHYFEGQPRDAAHKRAVAEVVGRRPEAGRVTSRR